MGSVVTRRATVIPEKAPDPWGEVRRLVRRST